MKLNYLAALGVPLLLAACSGGPPPATPADSSSAAPQAAAAAPANNDSLAPLFGTWAADLGQCGQQTGPIKISQTRFEGAENGCDITGYTDNGDGTFTAALACQSQGQTANENIRMRPIFAPTGEGIDLVYVDRDNQAFTVLRCKEPKAAN
ncbi:MAG TPA: hypothetical protein VG757_04475 [Devosia sp.]|nr:hypothetical protein [Devosia sp.]